MGPAALPCQHLSSRSSTAALRSALSSASHCLATSRSGRSGIARTAGRPLGGDAGSPDLLHTLHGVAVISPCMPQQPLPGRAPRRLHSQHHGGGNGHHGGGSTSSSHGATDNRVVDQLVAPSHPFLIADQTQGPSPQEVQDMLPLLTPKQLADAIWGFAKHDIKPDVDFMDAIALEIKSKLPYFRSQDLSNTLWALGMLKHQPAQDWWEEFDRQVYKHLTDFSDRELANLLWGFAVLGQRQAWVLDNVLSVASDNFESYSANSLHLIIWSLGKLSYVPSSDWLHSYLKATQANFFQFSPSEMANIIWALAKLGVRLPSMWLDNFLMVAQWRFPNFGAKLLSIVVWSCASLDHRPSQEWLVCFEQQVREKFNEFSGHELACVAWALRKFGYTNEHNAVFYMLDQQEQFLNVDFEILANSKLLRQVLGWRRDYNAGSSSTTGEA